MKNKKIKTCLTIAGSDNSGGAGLQADLKVFSLLGVFGFSAITSITVQNSKGVKASIPVSPNILESQINAIFEDFKINAIKIGMLQTKENVEVLLNIFKNYRPKNIVLDTVLKSSSGKYLLDKNAIESFKKLIKFTAIITPNTEEAKVLTGIEISSLDDMKFACEKLLKLGAKVVYLKGGHMDFKETIVDIFFDGSKMIEVKYEKLPVKENIHGTGCVLSSAIASFLAKGENLENACLKGRKFLQNQIKNAIKLGSRYLYMPLTQQ